jgi:hypothetical protein
MSADADRQETRTRPPELKLKLIDLAAVALRYVAPWVLLCVALYLLLRVAQIATQPGSDVLADLLSNVTRTRALAFIFGIMGMMYGIRERNLRRAAVVRLSTRVEALEREVAALRSPADS